jgi:hypothetical protein
MCALTTFHGNALSDTVVSGRRCMCVKSGGGGPVELAECFPVPGDRFRVAVRCQAP